MSRLHQFLLFTLLSILSGCGITRKSSKTQFVDDYYTQKLNGKKIKVYVNISDDNLKIHSTKMLNNDIVVDTVTTAQLYPGQMNIQSNLTTSFSNNSFDIDFLTIPLKFRPSQSGVPSQLNANLNGAGYFGYRVDRFSVEYIAKPLGNSVRHINHFGFSIGIFMGIGGTFMSPTNTNNMLQQEYDGVVWNKGLAGIFAVNNFTVGLAVGFDNLLDKNKNIWIYQRKPWIGVAFGLNIN